MGRLEDDVEGLVERVPEVVACVLDGYTLRLTLTMLSGEYDVAVLMPEEYPAGEPTDLEDFSLLKPGHVDDVCRQVVNQYHVRDVSGSGMGEYDSGGFDREESSWGGDAASRATTGVCHADEAALDSLLNAPATAGAADADAQFASAVAFCQYVHGAANVMYTRDDTRQRYHMRLAVPLDFLGVFQRAALYLGEAKRLVVELAWGLAYTEAPEVPAITKVYLSHAPSVEAVDGDPENIDESFGVVKWYIENRLKSALRLNWIHRRENRERAVMYGGVDTDGRGRYGLDDVEFRKTLLDDEDEAQREAKRLAQQGSTRPAVAPTASARANEGARRFEHVQVTPADDDDVENRVRMVCALGWPRGQALWALAKTNLHVENAIALIGDPQASAVERAALRDDAHWLHSCRLLKKKQVFYERMAVSGEGTATPHREHPSNVPMFNNPAALRFVSKYENFFEDGNTNILCGILRYAKQRLRTITSHCMVCDRYLGYEGVRTAVCEKAACGFSLEEFGLGCNPLAEIQRNGDVVDWMVHLTATAIQLSSSGARDSFNPWCPNIEVKDADGKTHDFHTEVSRKERTAANNSAVDGATSVPTGTTPSTQSSSQARTQRVVLQTNRAHKNFERLQAVVKGLPCIDDLASCRSAADMKRLLDAKDILAYPLLQWIIYSNRSHLMKLDAKHEFPGLGKHQYVLCSSTPEKERRFRRRREAIKQKGLNSNGSFWAWHGSGPGNWHAILRGGLRNFSNTTMMSSGAAYGPGIYLAKTISTSLSYVKSPASGWANSRATPANFTAMALCEVVDERQLDAPSGGSKTMHEHGGIIVVEDEDLVHTRFLFLFPGGFDRKGLNSGNEFRADVMKKPEEIMKLFDE